MTMVLVVDDSPIDRHVAGALLAEHTGWKVDYACDGREALEIMRQDAPDMVVTDMQMPELNGLELVEAIKREFSSIPVILMTAHGSEDIATAALQKGASSYVAKKNLARDLVRTVESVLSIVRAGRNLQPVLECLTEIESRFVLANSPSGLQPLIGYFQDLMLYMRIVEKSALIRIGTALHEALTNAIEHGNLEVRSELRDIDDRKAYQALMVERRQQAPYKDRKLHVYAKFTLPQALFRITDEGPGFDTSKLPDPTDYANLESVSGRGLCLIRTFMDEVSFNDVGNEITLIKRRKS